MKKIIRTTSLVFVLLLIAAALFAKNIKQYQLSEVEQIPKDKFEKLFSKLTKEEKEYFKSGALITALASQDKEKLGKITVGQLIDIGKKLDEKNKSNKSGQATPAQYITLSNKDPEFIKFWGEAQIAIKQKNIDSLYKYLYSEFIVGEQGVVHSYSIFGIKTEDSIIAKPLFENKYVKALCKAKANNFKVIKRSSAQLIDDSEESPRRLIPYLHDDDQIFKLTVNKDFPRMELFVAKIVNDYKIIGFWIVYGE